MPSQILQLQKTIGNRALIQLMKSRPLPLKTNPGTLQLENEENIQEDTAAGIASGQFIVEDTETPVLGQITKSEFMASLRGEVSKVASEVLAKIGQTSENCPYISYWFSYYEGKNDKHIEQAIKKYAPETSGAKDWQECIHILKMRCHYQVLKPIVLRSNI